MQDSDYKWELVADSAARAGRDGAGTLVLDGKMWVLVGTLI